MKFIKISLRVIAITLLVVLALGFFVSKPLPKPIGTVDEAERITDLMFESINKPAFDSINFIAWNYFKGHRFEWDKKNNQVKVWWDNNRVEFSPDDLSGKAYVNEQEQTGEEASKLINKAWGYFANDSFWLIAPFKARDPGTVRSLVETEEGIGLMVTYMTGGVTPGDSYVWMLDENYRPTAWRMWVKILPIGGLHFTWNGWKQHNGAWFATNHNGPGPISVNIVIRDIK